MTTIPDSFFLGRTECVVGFWAEDDKRVICNKTNMFIWLVSVTCNSFPLQPCWLTPFQSWEMSYTLEAQCLFLQQLLTAKMVTRQLEHFHCFYLRTVLKSCRIQDISYRGLSTASQGIFGDLGGGSWEEWGRRRGGTSDRYHPQNSSPKAAVFSRGTDICLLGISFKTRSPATTGRLATLCSYPFFLQKPIALFACRLVTVTPPKAPPPSLFYSALIGSLWTGRNFVHCKKYYSCRGQKRHLH